MRLYFAYLVEDEDILGPYATRDELEDAARKEGVASFMLMLLEPTTNEIALAGTIYL